MQRRRWQVLTVLAAVLALCATTALAGPTPSTAGADRVLTIKAAKLTGTVLYSDRRTPATKVHVRIWSVDRKKFVHQTITDDRGAYELPKLPVGRYLVVFGDRVHVAMVVDETKGLAGVPLNVVIPRGKAFISPKQLAAQLARSGNSFAAGGAAGFTMKTALLVAGGTATAVGVYEATDDSSTGGGDSSTTTTRRRRTRRTVVSP